MPDLLAAAAALKDLLALKAIGEEAGAFAGALDTLVRRAYRGKVGAATFANEMDALLSEYIRSSYLEGLAEGDIDESEMDATDEQFIRDMILAQRPYVDAFAQAVMYAKDERELRDVIDNRITMWGKSIRAAATAGVNSAKANEMVIFSGLMGKEDCPECLELMGARHRRSWFVKHGKVPGIPGNVKDGDRGFSCGGWNCEHTLAPIGGAN